MTDHTRDHGSGRGGVSPAEGAGTPVPVDLSEDRQARQIWIVFVGGPIIWFAHFMLVYLIAEAGCTGDGPGLSIFDPPVPVTATLVATVVAIAGCATVAARGFRGWRASNLELARAPDDVEDLAGEFDDDRRRGTLSFAGFILSAFSVLAVLFTATPAVMLGPC